MAQLIDLSKVRRSRRRVSFERHEIRQLMNVYSRRVASGEWRDYAIDHGGGMAIFSIFKHTHEVPLYRIAKTLDQDGGVPEWLVVSGRERLARSRSLLEALEVFDRRLEAVT